MIATQAACLALALLLDALLGEPDALWRRIPHPAVLMGRAVAGLDRRWNRGTARRARGIAALAVLAGGAAGLGAVIEALPGGTLWSVLLAAVLLAQKSLCQHVAAVADALDRGLPEGRRAVAMIVGRDTREMDGPAIARGAIESAAENLSDGIVAPAFWYLLLGLPGILAYKAVNTADSMIGYRTERHAAFGWAAARFDDLVNLVPARLTAGLIVILWRLWPRLGPILAEARRHRSPNAGWPEAAAARALGVALSGPRSYEGRMRDYPFVNPGGRHAIGAAEIRASVALLWRVWAALLGLVLLIAAIALAIA
ncbi:adenosylcobinamide-phosphate synthase CbiB [Mangrovicoccus algicola]|uniref:Cobalamin biosynthesis protein CobD n=1 Tax=Mangrovicoccus algicola TaxID=2771008 RepID=A0A8J6YZ99_9RHOB|nr:adenosylcobinamide-phosphate synthase CbiB [Mangrovicoccus algicola]MBE3638751.1 cobalamin biosynthesis protein [Mangrovicoccus algicola]